MQQRFYLPISVTLILLAGCAQSPSSQPVASPPAATSTSAPATPLPTAAQISPAAVAKSFTISPDGIGDAKVGSTFGQLKKALASKAEFKVISPFIVDFDAIAVVQKGQEQYYILYPAGQKLADKDVIEYVQTDNPNYKTAAGISPGTPIKQAAAAYGEATLSYNLDNEGREFVSFAKQPGKNMHFRTGSYGDGTLAGIYTAKPGSDGLTETKKYKETAAIKSIEVSCFPDKCQPK